MFYYTGEIVFTIDAYKKEIIKEFLRVIDLTSSYKSPWVETIKSDNICNCEDVSKPKGIWKQRFFLMSLTYAQFTN